MDNLTIAGPTLAALLHSLLTNCSSCDGLVLGSVCTTRTTQAHDAADAMLVEQHEGRISATCTCTTTQSFYTNTGDIVGEQLHKLLECANSSNTTSSDSSNSSSSDAPQQQLLGWFSYRPGTPCSPSMREAAVCKKLQDWRANSSSSSSQQPIVFGLITSQPDHNTATVSLQFKFYRVKDIGGSTDSSNAAAAAWTGNSGGFGSSSGFNRRARHDPEHPLLQPLDLAVHNLGAGQAAAAAAAGHTGLTGSTSSSSNKWGSASLPALAAVLQPPNAAGLSQRQVQQVQEAAAAQAGAALQAVQGLYNSLLDELQMATAQVAGKQSRLEALRASNQALQQQLLAGPQAVAASAQVAGESLL